MGIFSSKKKTYVYSSANRMIADSDIVISNQAAVTEYLLQNTLQTTTTLKELSIVDYMIQATQNSLPAKWGKAYRQAKEGKYHYGLPTSSILANEPVELDDVLTSMLSSNAQQPVELVYGKVGEINYFHMTRHKLVTEYGWDFVANELPSLSAQFGATVYMENFQLHYPPETIEDVTDERFFEQWGYSARAGKTHNREQDLEAPHSIVVENPSAITPFARVYYTYTLNGVIHEGHFDFGFDEIEDGQDFIMACYSYGSAIKFFTGKFGTGEYPKIEQVFETGATIGQFYPRMYARLDNRNLADSSLKETEAYKNCQNFWNAVDVNWSEWVNELHENMGDVSDITQTYITCSVSANAKDQDSVQYLFKYFKRLYKIQDAKRQKPSTYRTLKSDWINRSAHNGMSLVIQDKAHKQVLAFSEVGVSTEVGNIGPVGTYQSAHESLYDRKVTIFARPSVTRVHRYRRQVTENTIEVVSVYGLSLTEYVTGGYTVVSSGDSDSLLIPLDYSMSTEIPNRNFEAVLAKSLHVMVNTKKVVKVKWYQRGVFKAVLLIAAVIMSVFTGGQSLTLYTVFVAAVQAIAISVVVSLVAKLAVKLGVSVNLVAAVAVVVALITGYANLSGAKEVMGLSAQTLNQATNVALRLQGEMRQLEMKSLAKEMSAFTTEHENRMKELQELQDALAMDRQVLDNALWVSPDTHGVFINLGESPDDYYTRTIHSGNVGVLAIDVTLNSVQQMLQLPKPDFSFEIQGGI